MSDIFENDIDHDEDLSALEDTVETEDTGTFVFDKPLYHLNLEYSSESLYATMDKNIELNPGDYVITPTRYGKDIALVLGRSQKPVGVRPADIISIDRKATKDDLRRKEELKKRETEAYSV